LNHIFSNRIGFSWKKIVVIVEKAGIHVLRWFPAFAGTASGFPYPPAYRRQAGMTEFGFNQEWLFENFLRS
jgi:hypothetical protein